MKIEAFAAVKRQLQRCKDANAELRKVLEEVEAHKQVEADKIARLILERKEKLNGLDKRYSTLASKYKILKQLDHLSELKDYQLTIWFEQLTSLLPVSLKKEIYARKSEHVSLLIESHMKQAENARALCKKREEQLLAQEMAEKKAREEAEAKCQSEKQELQSLLSSSKQVEDNAQRILNSILYTDSEDPQLHISMLQEELKKVQEKLAACCGDADHPPQPPVVNMGTRRPRMVVPMKGKLHLFDTP